MPPKKGTQKKTPQHDQELEDILLEAAEEADELDLDDNVGDPDFNPKAPEIIEVLDADADDDNDGNISPQLPPSKKHKEREETRAERYKKIARKKESDNKQNKKIDIVMQRYQAKKSFPGSSTLSSTENHPGSSTQSSTENLPMGSGSDDTEMPTPLRKKPSTKRKKTSYVWNHCKSFEQGMYKCDHCSQTWTEDRLRGSTSNINKHMRDKHFQLLTKEDIESMTFMGMTSGIRDGKQVPPRSLIKTMYENAPALPRGHKTVKHCDRLLAKYIINSSTSMHILENRDFSNYVQALKDKYTLPSRGYMNDNIIPMFYSTFEVVKDILSKCRNIGLTADAWSSINHTSYITITAHTIDDNCKLHRFVLDTSEIKVRHTSENLIIHISKVLQKFDLKDRNNEISTTVSCMVADHDDDGVDLLKDTQDESQADSQDDSQESQFELQSQSQRLSQRLAQSQRFSQSQSQSPTHQGDSMQLEIDPDETQMSPDSIKWIEKTYPSWVKDGVPMLPGGLTMTTDNASDITRACKVLGNFNWFGCAGHHMNLVCQAAFKKVQAAAYLVKKAKRVVEHIRHSIPATYMLQEFQDFLELPLTKLVQENATRWWSITMMFETLVANQDAVCTTVRVNKRIDLQPNTDDFDAMKAIIELLKDFKSLGEALGAEDDVTISKVLPFFDHLKEKMKKVPGENPIIRDMKPIMLAKLNNRYDEKQMAFLRTCSLLDPRYKNTWNENVTLANDAYANLVTHVQYICDTIRKKEQRDSQQETIPPTQGQAQADQPSLITASKKRKKSTLACIHKDDVRPVNINQHTTEIVRVEVERYRNSVFLTSDQKDDFEIFKWWPDHSSEYPSLYQAFRATLSIPATSIPSERIFSLAGFILCKRRSQILAKNVNRYIFLNRNRAYIPPNTPVLAQEEGEPVAGSELEKMEEKDDDV